MGGTLTDAFHVQLKVSGYTNQTENPSISISESINDPRLPNDLITEIFLRLPVKSLLKFKCISKSWLSRISSPEFIKSHFLTSCKEGEYLKHQLLFTVESCIKQCSVYSALHESEPPTLVCDFEQLFENLKINAPCIVGIVNGLVCLAISATQSCLWNPALRKFKDLPSPIVNLEPPFTTVKAVNHGFGYDVLNDDYKVVCVLLLSSSEGVFRNEVKVYSLRADSWRRVNDDLKGLSPFYDAPTYADGKMYWPVDVVRRTGISRKVVSLDMTSEKRGELDLPDYETGYFCWRLGVVCGRLFAFCDHNGTKLDMFVMHKHGGEESWRKVDSIPLNDVNRRTPWPPEQVICFVSEDEIVIRSGHDLLAYHRKHKETRNIEVNVGESLLRVVPYVESLVWPSLDG